MDREHLVMLLSQEKSGAADTALLRDAAEHSPQDLIEIACNEAETAGIARIRAAQLLGRSRTTQAIVPLLGVLERLEDNAALFDAVTRALSGMGPALVEPVLAAYGDCTSADAQGAYLDVLVQCGVKDERIWKVLVAFLDSEPEYAAGLLATYGDPRAQAALTARLDTLEMQPGDPDMLAEAVVELGLAIGQLGGDLSPAQQTKVDLAQRLDPSRDSSAYLEAPPLL